MHYSRALTAALIPASIASAQVSTRSIPSLESGSYTLANGLRVVLHEDHKSPIVNVYVAYQVGSAAERPGKSGLAHMFEHLMFRGTEHSPEDYATELARLGATDIGGVTHQDYTRYLETVPSASLATALWMEAERMCCLLPALTQARLDEQRSIVRNEILEGQNQPYGRANEYVLGATYPVGHPYSRPAVGDVRDLDLLTLEDLRSFFHTYYTPNNAVLVVTGDFVADSARTLVDRYFGGIPAGSLVATTAESIAPPTTPRRMRVSERIPQARLTFVWNVPGLGTSDFDYLQLVANVLGSAGSAFTQRLVGRDLPATDVNAWVDARLTSSSFVVQIGAAGEAAFPRIEAAVSDEIHALVATGASDHELALAKADLLAGFTRRLERLGGFGGQSDEIGTNVVFAHDAAGHLARATRIEHATSDTIRGVVAAWLRHPAAIVEWVPLPRPSVAASARPLRPGDTEPAPPAFGTVEQARLKNGATVLLVRRPGNRMVSMQIVMPSGGGDDLSRRDAVAALTMTALTRGTPTRSAEQFSSELRLAGATLQGRADADYCTLSLSVPRTELSNGARLAADALTAPAFPQAELVRLQQEQARRTAQAAASPAGAWRPLILSALMGGAPTAPASTPIGREDVAAFHARWIRPDSATLIVAGDIALADLIPILDSAFRPWRPGRATAVPRAVPAAATEPIIYLIDRPGALQADVTAATLLPVHSAAQDAAVDAFVSVFGSGVGSRLSQDLRTDKGWAYSPTAGIVESRTRRLLLIRAPVRSNAAVDAVREIRLLVRELASDHPITAGELSQSIGEMTKSLASRWETTEAVGGAVAQVARVGMPVADYWRSYPSRIAALTRDEVTAIARSIDSSPQWVWVIVGDRSQLEAPLRAAGIGRIVAP